MLMCQFCRYEWSESTIEESFGFDSPVGELVGITVGSGAAGLQESAEDVLTLKCGACGAEVVVNTAEALQQRCHWCRQTLSVNSQLPNGAVPDGVLPFQITKEDAVSRITEFVKSRRFYAHPTFVRQFAPTEVVGVYLPYLLVDANAHLDLTGQGEILRRRYTRKQGNTTVTYYDADVYQLARSFDLWVDDVVIESSAERADMRAERNTNNIINSIQPFDVKNAVAYNANYLRGYTSEKRDLDIQNLGNEAYDRVMAIGRARADESIVGYDRGVRWESEHLTVTGSRWVAVYLPVWLYSYFDGELTHYVAVNGRTGETMGSIPIRRGRLFAVSTTLGVLGTILGGFIAWNFGVA